MATDKRYRRSEQENGVLPTLDNGMVRTTAFDRQHRSWGRCAGSLPGLAFPAWFLEASAEALAK
jgi:hypothetical protein